MWLLSLLSSTIFVVPVFVTFGVYFAVEHQRILECGLNCEDAPGAGGYLPGEPSGSDIIGELYCQKTYAVTPDDGRYIFNPNQWGDPLNTGSLCINFTSEAPEGSDIYSPGWLATWNYTIPGPIELPVHAFPNANLKLEDGPVQLSSVSGLTVDVSWRYGVGNGIQAFTDYNALFEADVNANICVDMFLGPDKTDSANTTKASYEVMVWLGRFGLSTDPLGFDLGALDTRIINGTTFNLYQKDNSLGQHALTWLADQNITEFTGDIGPLLQDLTAFSGPLPTDYLGYVAFGSETFYAETNATFYVPKLEMDVITR